MRDPMTVKHHPSRVDKRTASTTPPVLRIGRYGVPYPPDGGARPIRERHLVRYEIIWKSPYLPYVS
jgi:hypothetical protein